MKEKKMRSDARIFVKESENPEETRRILMALSAEASLTDDLAVQILTRPPFYWTEERATRFITYLHWCDFVVEGNFNEFSVRPYENKRVRA